MHRPRDYVVSPTGAAMVLCFAIRIWIAATRGRVAYRAGIDHYRTYRVRTQEEYILLEGSLKSAGNLTLWRKHRLSV